MCNSKHFIKASCTERRGSATSERGAKSLLSKIRHLPWSTEHSCRAGPTFIPKFHLPLSRHQRASNLKKHRGRSGFDWFENRTGLSLWQYLKNYNILYGQTHHILYNICYARTSTYFTSLFQYWMNFQFPVPFSHLCVCNKAATDFPHWKTGLLNLLI